MREMKDSEIEWIKAIPSNWKISKIDQLYIPRNTKVSDFDYQPLSVTMQGIVPQLETAAKTNAHDSRKLVMKGDFAINSRSDRRGSCGISEYTGSVSLINTVLRPKEDMNARYYNWLFHTSMFSDEFYRWGHGIVDDLWSTGWQEMKKISIPSPSLQEQQKIADFLDQKCAEIDALTSDIQTQIETLEEYKKSVITEAVTKGLDPKVEMKDSRCFYIGNINKSWKVTKIGYVCKKLYRPVDEHLPPLICSNKGNVQERDSSLIGKMVSENHAMQGIKCGDIAIHGMDTWHGAIATSSIDGNITRVVHVCQSLGDNRFIVYYLQSLAYRNVYKLISNGIRGNTSDFRSWDLVKKIFLPFPSIEEQHKIANYLDNKCSDIESIIIEKQQQLETLAEYKKSLIYEYVTGKKEVA